MSDENNSPPSPRTSSFGGRRSSFSPGQALSDLFGRSSNAGAAGPPAYPGPITTAAANAQAQQRRRMSLSSLSNPGTSPTSQQGAILGRGRRESMSSTGSANSLGGGVVEESAIEEGDASPSSPLANSPFARRLSFGARALRDVRTGSGSANGEGFNWSENQRSRAESTVERSAFVNPSFNSNATTTSHHQRRQSMSTMPIPTNTLPPARANAPDHMQERILKGDFYMD
jgi:hypothetical protein